MLWWNGPRELEEKLEFLEEMPVGCIDELRASECRLLVNESERAREPSAAIDIQRYSSLNQLLLVTVYTLKFLAIVELSVRENRSMAEVSTMVKELPVSIDEAEYIWIKEVQNQLYKDKNFQKWKAQLRLFADELGIWRCGGRLANADLPYQTKRPILLPGRHHFTVLVIRRAHERVFHNGVKETLNEMRARFWILKGRANVRKLIHQCVLCRRLEGQAYAAPQMPPLPYFRVTEEPPFTYTGIDFAGPLFVKSNEYEIGGKVWLCLYTCCVTRAIHLDLLHNMSFDFFIRSFKRFVNRRGLPRRIISDNAKTFKGAA
jgi:hypothetical protein